ncbi:efflux RND transporter periplasmic adaptor subunit [Desulfovibrio sp. UIB00]|uniref:efflux RND transporter periplasmic adaptor subunit n=1 Tax=Desulfovibrio sp. UIB00 TaxID=2804314 RepID=UPI001F1144C3|nr:efflux RND transporter periplasmic adaptor subunit [Desulfovibrio sp. UIB00]MCH5146160.1 efflux RND transporter periplasmic adaptor subunit [Desulfovibrio sp. UIB00]
MKPKHQKFMIVFILFCISFLQSGCSDNDPSSNTISLVRYITISKERIALTSDLPGRVTALVTAEVRPQVDGIIQERLFEEGADVEKGDVLYKLDAAVYQAAYDTAKAELDEALISVQAQQKRENRVRSLASANAVSQQSLEDSTADNGRAKARVARAKAALETAEINLAYTRIKAPVSGRIGRSSVTPGALVNANQSAPLAVIQQIDRVYVDMTQSSADMLRLRRIASQLGSAWGKSAATRARLTLEDGSPYAMSPDSTGATQWILGDLLFSEISVTQTTGSVNLRAIFPNPEGLLLPGMYVRVSIEEGAIENALLLPQRSVLSGASGGHFVLTLKKLNVQTSAKHPDETFAVVKKDVVLDRPYGGYWLVKSGLEAGDIVVVEGLQKALPLEKVRGEQASAANIKKDANPQQGRY